jgi:TonB-linked SusC/RagA family outer membrane protein
MSGSLDYEMINDLHLKGLIGVMLNDKDAYSYQEPWFDGSWYALESFSKANAKLKQYIATFTLNYDKTFGSHQISGLLGYEARRAYSSFLDYANQESFVARPQSSSLALGVESQTGSFWETDVLDRILSQFARLEYSYQNKYLLTANVRRDGYGSKFGPENKYGIFPGVSVGWVLTKESFMSGLSFINLLKLRAGYGILGNPVGQDFAFTRYYTLGYTYDWSGTSAAGQRETGIAIVDALANAEIQWESVATTNVGIDASFWKGRLAFNLDFYSRQTQKMLYNVGIPPSAGVGSSVQANIGQMSNTGFEIQVEHRNDIGDFNYFVSFTGGFNKNKLISLNPDLERLFITSGNIGQGESGGGFYGGATICRSEPGLPLGQFYGYETAGIYATDAEAGTRPTFSGYTPQAGDLIYVDQNNDLVINASDQVYIGNPWPKMTYGFNLGGGWKSIEVRAQFNGTIGNDIYNGHDSYEYNFFSDYNTSPKIFDASFFGDNDLTDIPRSATLSKPDRNRNWGAVSDYHIYDGSYLRLKNLQVSYTLPEQMVGKMHMSYIKVFFSADNLLTITKYPGLDPEIAPQANYGGILAQGIDFPSPRYPLSRIISFGVNMTF